MTGSYPSSQLGVAPSSRGTAPGRYVLRGEVLRRGLGPVP